MFNFRDPRIIHISVEILIIVAFVFWITSKNKQTTFFIRNILQRIDEQEERILKLEARLAAAATPAKIAAAVPAAAPAVPAPPAPLAPTVFVVPEASAPAAVPAPIPEAPAASRPDPRGPRLRGRHIRLQAPAETPTLTESLDDDLKEELAELNDQLSNMGEALRD